MTEAKRQASVERLIRAADQILATYRAHWRDGEDVILEDQARELALARDDLNKEEDDHSPGMHVGFKRCENCK